MVCDFPAHWPRGYRVVREYRCRCPLPAGDDVKTVAKYSPYFGYFVLVVGGKMSVCMRWISSVRKLFQAVPEIEFRCFVALKFG